VSKNIKYFFEQSWLLMVSSVLFGLLLALTNAAWAPRIAQNQIDKFNTLVSRMLPNAQTFKTEIKDMPVESQPGKIIETDIKKALDASGRCTGWAFEAEGAGFADKIKLVITFDAKFEKIMGYGVLASNETPGFGDQIKDDYFRKQFVGAPAQILILAKSGDREKIDSEIIAITGATVSSEAVVRIINGYTDQVKKQLQDKGLIGNE
jgi:electron transport complex protein RnfG